MAVIKAKEDQIQEDRLDRGIGTKHRDQPKLLNIARGWDAGVVRLMSLALSIVVGGCGFHLHNAADDALARRASGSLRAADVAKFVADERAVLRAAEERDIAAMRGILAAERDAVVISALTRTTNGDPGGVERRLRSLGYPADLRVQEQLADLPQRRRAAMQWWDAYLVAIVSTPEIQHDRRAPLTMRTPSSLPITPLTARMPARSTTRWQGFGNER